MKVVLLDDVDNVGEAGDTVVVKSGYARNYLIPMKLADFARPDTLNRVAQIKKSGEARRIARLKEEKAIIDALSGKTLVIFARSGQENKLFGAVTSQTVSDAIKASYGTRLDRKFIRLAAPIKHLGEFPVELRASSEIKAEIIVIVKSEDERESHEKGEKTPAAEEPASEAVGAEA